MYKGLDWEVQKYGTVVQSHKYRVSTRVITTKIYYYKDHFYIETWIDEIRYYFHEIV